VGPIVGAGVLVIVPQLISGLERFQNLVFFTLLLGLILLRPNGLFGVGAETVPLSAMLPRLDLAALLQPRRSDPRRTPPG
jgi:hypothetical protein